MIAKAGGRRWWTTLSGRVKAQRAYNLGASGRVGKVGWAASQLRQRTTVLHRHDCELLLPGSACRHRPGLSLPCYAQPPLLWHHPPSLPLSQLEAARDLGNYGLCARSRVQLGRRLALNAVVEAPDTHALVQRLSELREAHAAAAASSSGSGAAAPGPSAAAASLAADGPSVSAAGGGGASGPQRRRGHTANPPELEPCMAHASLRCVLPGHDLTATAGYNLQYVDSTGDVSHVPLAVSLDLASHDRQDGLQYRVGLHQVRAVVGVSGTGLGHTVAAWHAVDSFDGMHVEACG